MRFFFSVHFTNEQQKKNNRMKWKNKSSKFMCCAGRDYMQSQNTFNAFVELNTRFILYRNGKMILKCYRATEQEERKKGTHTAFNPTKPTDRIDPIERTKRFFFFVEQTN